MGTDYSLFRVAHEIAGDVEARDDLETLPFGTFGELVARLQPLATSRFEIPPHSIRLGFEREGRTVSLTLTGDPVMCLSVDHAAPWDLAPFVEMLAELGPFVVFDPQRGVFLDPRSLKPPEPVPRAAPHSRTTIATVGATGLELAWSVRAHEPYGFYYLGLLDAGERLIVVDAAGVTAVDLATGESRWSLACGRGRSFAGVGTGTLLVGSDHPDVFGLDVATGAVRFTLPIRGRVCHAPVPCPGGWLVGTEAGIVSLVAPDGTVRWTHDGDGAVYTAPAILDADRAVIATNEGTLSIVALADGSTLATRTLPAIEINERSYSPSSCFGLVVADGRIHARFEGRIASFDFDLAEVASAGVEHGGGFDGLVLAGRRLWAPIALKREAGYVDGQFSLDLALGDATTWSGDGRLSSPSELRGGVAFADATDDRIDIEVAGADGELARVTLPVGSRWSPRVVGCGDRLIVAGGEVIAAFTCRW